MQMGNCSPDLAHNVFGVGCSRKRLELSRTVAIWFFNKVDATREESQRRERPAIAGAEGATAPETLRQKDRRAR